MRRNRALVKYRGRYYGLRSLSIKILLKQLGLPRHIWCVRNFWEHWQGQLEYVLYDAEKVYKRHAIRVHPRKQTDDQEEAKELNALWLVIKQRIREHLQPSLHLHTVREARKRLKPPKGYFLRTCLADHCRQPFFAKSNKVNFCCEAHMYSTLNARRYKEKKRARRKILVKCQFSRCGRLFWRFADLKKRKFCSPKCSQYFHVYKFRDEHPEITNARNKSWRERNLTKAKTAAKKYREEHRDELNKKKAPWKRKWRKKMKALRPVVRQSLIDLLKWRMTDQRSPNVLPNDQPAANVR